MSGSSVADVHLLGVEKICHGRAACIIVVIKIRQLHVASLGKIRYIINLGLRIKLPT